MHCNTAKYAQSWHWSVDIPCYFEGVVPDSTEINFYFVTKSCCSMYRPFSGRETTATARQTLRTLRNSGNKDTATLKETTAMLTDTTPALKIK